MANAILKTLETIAGENTSEPDEFFERAIGLIQYEAVQRNIEFDGYFQEKWEIESEFPVSFDEEYFENENRSELYVYLAALVDGEIFQYLAFAWEVFWKEDLTTEILHAEISQLKERGVRF